MSVNKRDALAKAYPGYSWQDKVAHMPPEQVVAIYLRFQRDGWPNTEPKLNPDLKLVSPDPERVEPSQLKLF